MSFQSLYTAATGMQAMETKLDVIANNLANNNTVGFKKDRANFEDLLYRQTRLPGALDSDGNRTATGIDVGLGVRVSSTQADFDQGAFQNTGNQLDMAIEGEGFFGVQGPNGETLYTRAGNFNLNAEGEIVLGSASVGYRLVPGIQIPPEAIGISISGTGEVTFRQAGQTQLSNAGVIQLSNFQNPDGLLKLGDNLFQETEASGPVTTANPLSPGFGSIQQGFLESSNVQATTELIDLINTQRSFELNSQVIRAGDEIMELVANLRR
ncbi:flagellar basal-body rod protein FlgG [Botrimarina sp.]|uniref:flagellar basal-body rod protein FlgG n=1 Tax=Botrimarina sp. TaxID=2795802 RepID=UPI0032EAE3AC